MKKVRFFLVVLGLVLTSTGEGIALASPPQSPAPTAERHVCPVGPPTCHYPTIQAALDGSNAGDVIKVATGLYDDLNNYGGLSQIAYVDKAVVIEGGYTTDNWDTPDPVANPTTLDAQGLGRGIYVVGTITPTIAGLRIAGGDANAWGGSGGGIYVDSAGIILRDNTIYSNTAAYGGGAYAYGGSVFLDDNTFADNDATDSGGGFYQDFGSTTLTGNTFSGNSANIGGGIALDHGNASLGDGTFSNNTAGQYGGGLYADFGEITLTGCTFQGNMANDHGGGLYAWANDTTVEDSLFESNLATTYGGGLMLAHSDLRFQGNQVRDNNAFAGGGLYVDISYDARIDGNTFSGNMGRGVHLSGAIGTMDNNVFVQNEEAGLYVGSASLRMRHNTFHDNTGGTGRGIYAGGGTLYLTNTILVSETVGLYVDFSGSAIVDGVLWFGNATNTVNMGSLTVTNALTGNPALAPDGLHLTVGSAALGQAISTDLRRDIDGQYRPMGLGPDLGADEYAETGLVLEKTAHWPLVAPPNPDQPFTYTIAITGVEANATMVALTDTLPALQRALAADASTGSCSIQGDWGGRVVCALGDVPVDSTAFVTLTVEFSDATPPGQLVVNTVEVRANETVNQAAASTYAQDCHVRLNDDPTEHHYVQAAVDAAAPGDLIKVAGTCLGSFERAGLRQQAYLERDLTLRGGYNADFGAWDPSAYPTVLDAQQVGRVLYVEGPIEVTLEGLEITGGAAAGLGGYGTSDAGGGIYANTTTLSIDHCRIYSNTADWGGGGIYARGEDFTLVDSTLSGNQANHYGGALFVGGANSIIIGNTFHKNDAPTFDGGHLFLYYGSASVNDNIFTGNTAGTGVTVSSGNATLTGNTISDNGQYGLYSFFGQTTLRDNVISDNGDSGIHSSSSTITITGNLLTGNTGQDAGAVEILGGRGLIVGNVITGNSGVNWGGGVLVDQASALLVSNTIISNTAGGGGGVGLYVASAELKGNLISQNEGGQGGGVNLVSSYARFRGNRIVGNYAYYHGGGLSLYNSAASMTNTLIADNEAFGAASGLYVEGANVNLRHSTIARNRGAEGSGIYIIADVWNDRYSQVRLTNTILVSHTIGVTISQGNIAWFEGSLWGSGPWANKTDWAGSGLVFTGTINIWGVPAFADAGTGGYHLGPGSAALDQGVNLGVPIDIDNEPRPYQVPDLGADEYWPPGILHRLYLPLIQR